MKASSLVAVIVERGWTNGSGRALGSKQGRDLTQSRISRNFRLSPGAKRCPFHDGETCPSSFNRRWRSRTVLASRKSLFSCRIQSRTSSERTYNYGQNRDRRIDFLTKHLSVHFNSALYPGGRGHCSPGHDQRGQLGHIAFISRAKPVQFGSHLCCFPSTELCAS